MRPSSAKQKGRLFQQKIRDDLRVIGEEYGLDPADCESRGMGQQGEDLILTPSYRKILNLDIECKSVQNLVVPTTFWGHYSKYIKRPSLKLLIHKRNREEPLATLRWADLLQLLRRLLKHDPDRLTTFNSVSESPRRVLHVQEQPDSGD